MKNSLVLKVFNDESTMSNKLYLGFLVVVASIIATNLIVSLFITDAARNRALFASIGLAVGMALGSLISNYMVRHIGDLVSATRLIGEGDLTKEVTVSSSDEIGELAKSFNQMVFNFRELIVQFRESSEDIIGASKVLSCFVSGVNSNAQEVAEISNHISLGAEKQSLLLENTFNIMKRMAESLQRVAERAQIAANTATKAGETARREGESMEKTREELERIFSKIENSTGLIRVFGDKIQKITKIADIITGVAEQTNLLSLNASIEAARAGEFGKGFSVVAEEVRRLAEKAKDYAEGIETIIDEIQKDNTKVVASLEEQTQGVKFGRKTIETAVHGLTDIMQKVMDMVEEVKAISSITQQQKDDAQLVVANMGNVSKLAGEHLTATAGTARAANAQLESIQKMVSSTHDLSLVSERLQNAVLKFKVEMKTE
jgi:methyl-accepting chemotaxis protein